MIICVDKVKLRSCQRESVQPVYECGSERGLENAYLGFLVSELFQTSLSFLYDVSAKEARWKKTVSKSLIQETCDPKYLTCCDSGTLVPSRKYKGEEGWSG